MVYSTLPFGIHPKLILFQEMNTQHFSNESNTIAYLPIYGTKDKKQRLKVKNKRIFGFLLLICNLIKRFAKIS